MPYRIQSLSYDIKQDWASIIMVDDVSGIMTDNVSGLASVRVTFPLATGDGRKEKQLEERVRQEAKKQLQAALKTL
jgi:hypothetical protein